MARSSDERWTAGAILVCLYAIFIVWFCGFPMAPTPITEVDAEVSWELWCRSLSHGMRALCAWWHVRVCATAR
jgi:hypothetical protein